MVDHVTQCPEVAAGKHLFGDAEDWGPNPLSTASASIVSIHSPRASIGSAAPAVSLRWLAKSALSSADLSCPAIAGREMHPSGSQRPCGIPGKVTNCESGGPSEEGSRVERSPPSPRRESFTRRAGSASQRQAETSSLDQTCTLKGEVENGTQRSKAAFAERSRGISN